MTDLAPLFPQGHNELQMHLNAALCPLVKVVVAMNCDNYIAGTCAVTTRRFPNLLEGMLFDT